jgi:hypothetical protein
MFSFYFKGPTVRSTLEREEGQIVIIEGRKERRLVVKWLKMSF